MIRGPSTSPPSQLWRPPTMIWCADPVSDKPSAASACTQIELGSLPPFSFQTRKARPWTLCTTLGSIDAFGWQTSGPESAYGPIGFVATPTVTHGRPDFLRAL